MSETPQTLEDQLIRDEGEVLHVYPDSLGFLTIGVGHLVDARKGGSIPKEISRALLDADIEVAKAFLRTHFPWTLSLDQIRLAALVNMSFNLRGNLEGFHVFLAKLQAGDYQGAAAAGRDSLWHKQTGDRAERLMRQIETGEWV